MKMLIDLKKCDFILVIFSIIAVLLQFTNLTIGGDIHTVFILIQF